MTNRQLDGPSHWPNSRPSRGQTDKVTVPHTDPTPGHQEDNQTTWWSLTLTQHQASLILLLGQREHAFFVLNFTEAVECNRAKLLTVHVSSPAKLHALFDIEIKLARGNKSVDICLHEGKMSLYLSTSENNQSNKLWFQLLRVARFPCLRFHLAVSVDQFCAVSNVVDIVEHLRRCIRVRYTEVVRHEKGVKSNCCFSCPFHLKPSTFLLLVSKPRCRVPTFPKCRSLCKSNSSFQLRHA